MSKKKKDNLSSKVFLEKKKIRRKGRHSKKDKNKYRGQGKGK